MHSLVRVLLAPLYLLVRLCRRPSGLHAAPRTITATFNAPDPVRAPRIRPYAPVADWEPLPADGPGAPALVRPYVLAEVVR